VNLKTKIADHVGLLVVMRIRFESIVKRSMDGRISKKVGPKQGKRRNSMEKRGPLRAFFRPWTRSLVFRGLSSRIQSSNAIQIR
jgi:hypothetical protein